MQNQDPNSTDPLSALGRQLLRLDSGTVYKNLVASGSGSAVAQSMLQSVGSRDLIDGPIISEDDADGVLAALWLRHDFLDESHKISQRLESPTGSFWHAIMHRREGDFSNSKYWYRQAGEHPALQVLANNAADAINRSPADKSIFRIIATGWNPSAYVDLVEAVHQRQDDPRHDLAVLIQEIEWQTLFTLCTRAAAGK